MDENRENIILGTPVNLLREHSPARDAGRPQAIHRPVRPLLQIRSTAALHPSSGLQTVCPWSVLSPLTPCQVSPGQSLWAWSPGCLASTSPAPRLSHRFLVDTRPGERLLSGRPGNGWFLEVGCWGVSGVTATCLLGEPGQVTEPPSSSGERGTHSATSYAVVRVKECAGRGQQSSPWSGPCLLWPVSWPKLVSARHGDLLKCGFSLLLLLKLLRGTSLLA